MNDRNNTPATAHDRDAIDLSGIRASLKYKLEKVAAERGVSLDKIVEQALRQFCAD